MSLITALYFWPRLVQLEAWYLSDLKICGSNRNLSKHLSSLGGIKVKTQGWATNRFQQKLQFIKQNLKLWTGKFLVYSLGWVVLRRWYWNDVNAFCFRIFRERSRMNEWPRLAWGRMKGLGLHMRACLSSLPTAKLPQVWIYSAYPLGVSSIPLGSNFQSLSMGCELMDDLFLATNSWCLWVFV